MGGDDRNANTIASLVAIVCAMLMVLLHLAIAADLSLGRAAVGDPSQGIPIVFKMGSAVAAGLHLFFLSVLLQVGGFRSFGYPKLLCRRVTWLFFVIVFLAAALNWVSQVAVERYCWGSFGLVYCSSCFVVALSFHSSQKEHGAAPSENDPLV